MRSDIDATIAALAARQEQMISRRQLAEAGFDMRRVRYRENTGSLVRITERVLALPGYEPSLSSSLWAAVLDSAPGTAVSHESAARLRRFEQFVESELVVVTVLHGTKRTTLADRVHQTRHPLAVGGVGRLPGLPVSTSEQVVLQLAPRLSRARLESLLDDGLVHRGVDLDRMWRAWTAYHRQGRRPLLALGRLLAARSSQSATPAGELERLLRKILDGADGVTFEAPFPGRERSGNRVDALTMPERVITEGDGRSWHSRVADFAKDRQRDRAAARAGFLVIRFAAEEMKSDPLGVRQEYDAICAQRRRDLGLDRLAA